MMSDTQALLIKLAALRQRLAQNQPLAGASGEGPAAGSGQAQDPTAQGAESHQDGEASSRVNQLQEQVLIGSQENSLLDDSIRKLADAGGSSPAAVCRPAQLTFRARRILQQGRDLLGRLLSLSEDPLLKRDPADPLDASFRETTAMVDMAMRMVQAFPDAPSSQLQLCQGLEVILEVADQRVRLLTAALAQRRREHAWIEDLAGLLADLEANRPVGIQPFATLAEELLAEAHQGAPLRFLYVGPEQPARFVAGHSLMVAQVVARVVRQDGDFRDRPLESMLAALLHDVGMLRVPAEVLAQSGPLNDEQRRAVESHTRAGATMVTPLSDSAGWLAEVAASHHERLDGTGYPAGHRAQQINPLTRLVAVCDTYAALCTPRPYRSAKETRTALTDTLLLAEQGALDRNHAEHLLTLSFYPVGAAVELADGAMGIVVASPQGRRDLSTPARPVVALLSDSQNQFLPSPQYVDLAQCEGRSIVRSLSAGERRQVFGKRYPELAA